MSVHPDPETQPMTDLATVNETSSDGTKLTGLSSAQIKLRTSKNYKGIVMTVMLLFNLIDILGTILFMPAGGILCQRAEGGPTDSMAQVLMLPTEMNDGLSALGAAPDLILLHDSLKATISCADPAHEGTSYPALASKSFCSDPTITEAAECVTPATWTADSDDCEVRDLYIRGDLDAEFLAWDTLGMPKAFAELPFGFSTSMNVLVMMGSLSSGLGGAMWGMVSDKIGVKICAQLCLLGGTCGYVLMYMAGVEWNSFWAYAAGQVVNGLFSGSAVLVPTYITKMFPPEEAAKYQGLVMLNSMVGAGLGALLLMPFISGRGENVFNAAWVGIIGSVVFFFLVTFVVAEPKKAKKEEKIDAKMEDAKPTPKTPAMITKMLWIVIVAGAFDAAGDEGTRIARGTILQNKFPDTNSMEFQNLLILSLIGVALVSMIMTGIGKGVCGFGATAVLGATATCVTQFLLMTMDFEGYGLFLALWYGGKTFGFLSTFSGMFIIAEMAPDHEKGKWNGISSGVSGIIEAAATLSMALVYDTSLKDANAKWDAEKAAAAEAGRARDMSIYDEYDDALRGKATLMITVTVSCIAILAYLPLIPLATKPKDEEKEAAKFHTVEEYQAMSEKEKRQLTLEEAAFVGEKMMAMDPPIMPDAMTWGDYSEQRPELIGEGGLQDRARADFKFMKKWILDALTSQEKMDQMRVEMKMTQEWEKAINPKTNRPNVDKEAAKAEMGSWLADYLDDAGYENWSSYPCIYKAMFINAFPPIDPLDDKVVDPDTADIEGLLLGFLDVADKHVKHTETNFFDKLKPRAIRTVK